MTEFLGAVMLSVWFATIFDSVYKSVTHRTEGPFGSLVDAVLDRTAVPLLLWGMVLGTIALGLVVVVVLLRGLVWAATF
jgi:hypothetical protein